MQMLHETEAMSYKVMVDGVVLNECPSEAVAKQFILTLSNDARLKAKIVPILESGKQILLG